MTDLKPPRLDGGERETLLALLQYLRESMVKKLTGVSDEDARRRFVDSDTTLLWLAKHLTMAETIWIVIRFHGDDVPVPDDTVHPDDSLDTAIATYRSTWETVDAIVAAADLDDRCRKPQEGMAPVNLRWILVHLLEEIARHAGHADILRELIDGQTGR